MTFQRLKNPDSRMFVDNYIELEKIIFKITNNLNNHQYNPLIEYNTNIRGLMCTLYLYR